MSVIDINITDLQEDYMVKYMRSVLEDRSIPDLRDGLKPIQRYCIWDAFNEGHTYDKPHVKCALGVGSIIGKYSPHGDQSAYMAMMRLAQNFSLNIPLINPHGKI